MRIALSIALFAALATTLPAQTLWRGRSEATSIGFELLRPNFTDRNTGFSGIIATFSGAFNLNPGNAFIVELPLVFSSYSSPYGFSQDEGALGNPYVGMQFGPSGATCYGDFGVRIPIMDDQKNLSSGLGTLADIDRFEAYVPHLFQASAALDVDSKVAPGLRLLGRVGPSGDFATKGGGSANYYADYGLTLEFQQEDLTLGAGYSARTLLSQSSIDDRTIDQITVGGYLRFPHIEPGLQARFPLDDSLRKELDFTYALNVRFFN
jgi:hypothetical protein